MIDSGRPGRELAWRLDTRCNIPAERIKISHWIVRGVLVKVDCPIFLYRIPIQPPLRAGVVEGASVAHAEPIG